MAAGNIKIQANDTRIYTLTPEDGASGNVALTLPKEGGMLTVDAEVVHKTGDETIAGVKTFMDNVGIGTSSPIGKLQVKGANPQLFIEDTSGGTNGKFTAIGTNNGVMTFSRYLDNGTLDSEKMRIDSIGNLLLTSGTGALGYGTGSGGTVTQITSKSTAIALGKPSGRIITHNSSLSANSSTFFQMINPCVGDNDNISWSFSNAGASALVDYTKYDLAITVSSGGNVYFVLRNLSGSALSDVITIDFTLNRGAIS